MPPLRIDSRSSFLSFRSPWLSFGSHPLTATVRGSTTTLPCALRRSTIPAIRASLPRSGSSAAMWALGMARLPGPGRVQPAERSKDPVLQVGHELGQDPHRPPGTDRDLDQSTARSRQLDRAPARSGRSTARQVHRGPARSRA